LDLEERILVPTLFFFVTVAWGVIFQRVILNELREVDAPHFQKTKSILSPHFQQVTYSDAIFVFMVNGIVWILQLYQTALGVLVMVTGVILAVTGLLSTFMWRDRRDRTISEWTLRLTLIVAAIEFAMFVFIP